MKFKKISAIILLVSILISSVSVLSMAVSADKKMNKLVRSATNENQFAIEIPQNSLVADKEYTIEFEYKMFNREFNKNVSLILFGDSNITNTRYADKMLFKSSNISNRGTKFPSCEIIDDVKAIYKFTLTQAQIDTYQMFYLGFYFESVAANTPQLEIYLGDFTLYASSDEVKTNLLPADRSYKNWYAQYARCSSSACALLDYDEDMFARSSMLNIKRQPGDADSLKLKVPTGKIKADTEYTVSFKQQFNGIKYDEKAYFALFGETEAEKYGDTIIFASRKYGEEFLSFDAVGSTFTYTFMLTSNQLTEFSDFYLGFYFPSNTEKGEIFITDFVLYETIDDTKTNLLSKNDRANKMTDWYTDTLVGSGNELAGASYILLDDSVFVEKKMNKLIRTTATTENHISLALETGTIVADTEYTIEFEYKINNRELNKNVSFVVYGDQYPTNTTYGNKLLYNSSGISGRGTLFPTREITNDVKAKYTFSLTEEQLTTYPLILLGFYFEKVTSGTPQGEIYVGDFTLYQSSDEDKTNLLPGDRSYNNWYTGSAQCSTSNCKLMTYDPEMFAAPSMLYINRLAGVADSLKLKVPSGAIVADTEYTVSFKQQFNGLKFNEHAYFGLFGETEAQNYGDAVILASKKIGDSFASEKLTGSTYTYTFSLNETELAKYTDLYLGFYFPQSDKSGEIFITDFVLYESDDETIANLLSKNDRAVKMTDWYTDTKVGKGYSLAGAEYIVLDESVFIEKKMNKLIRTTATTENHISIELAQGTLEANTEYTVEFEYRIFNREFNKDVSFVLYADQYVEGTTHGNEILYCSMSKSGRGSLFQTREITGDARAKFTFTLTEEQITTYPIFYLGFYFEKVASGTAQGEVYVGDFTLYKSEDTRQSNLLPSDRSYKSWYTASAQISTSNCKWVAYDPEMFLPLSMLNIKRTAGTSDSLKLRIPSGTISADTEYKVSFKQQFNGLRYDENAYFALFGETESEKYGDQVIYASNKIGERFAGVDVLGSTCTYTFELTADQLALYTDLYLGFYFPASSENGEIYITDFVLYESLDETKTNLLSKDDRAENMRDWYTDDKAGKETELSGAQYVILDNSVFKEKTMVRVNRTSTTNNYFFLKVPTGTIKEDTEYTVEFDYNCVSGRMNEDYYFCLNGETNTTNNQNGEAMIRSSSLQKTAFEYSQDNGANAIYKFKLSDISKYYDFYLGFYFDSSNPQRFYIADFVLYESEDPQKRNLLSKDEYSTSMSDWYCSYSTASSVGSATYKYEVYNPSLFVKPNTDRTVFYYTNSNNQTDNLSLKVPVDMLVQNRNYTISFSSNFLQGALSDNVSLALLGKTGDSDNNYTVIFDDFDENQIGNKTLYNFTTPQKVSEYTNLYIGFIVDGTAEFYIGDIKMYLTDTALRNNLLSKDKYSADITDWHSDFGKMKYITVGTANSNADNVVDIRDLVTLNDKIHKVVYDVTADIDADCASDDNDISAVRKMILNNRDYISSESPLSNTYKLLNQEKKLTIGYIGGSITWGSSATSVIENGKIVSNNGDIGNSWVNRTTKWFREEFPDATIESVNAGISGTATNMGLYRLQSTLMNTNGHDMPDLVFIEWTNNDLIGSNQTYSMVRKQVESMYLNLRAINPYVEIVVISTNTSDKNPSRVIHREMADYYNIPFIDVGMPLQALKEQNSKASEISGSLLYTVDNLHPSALGYEEYFKVIKQVLTNALNESTINGDLFNYEANMPVSNNSNLITAPKLLGSEYMTYSENASVVNSPVTADYHGTNESNTIVKVAFTDNYLNMTTNSTVDVQFSGSVLGLLLDIKEDQNIVLKYSIDGGEEKYFRIDDSNYKYERFAHAQMFMISQDLGKGNHTLTITSQSDTDVALGAILVNQP